MMTATPPRGLNTDFYVLYYCHACSLRLNGKEAAAALKRGESHNSACCEACIQLGRRVKDPAAIENSIHKPVSDDHEEPEFQTAPTTRPKSGGSAHTSKISTPRKSLLSRHDENPKGKIIAPESKGPPWAIIGAAGGVAVLLLCLILFRNTAKKNSASVSDAASQSSPASFEKSETRPAPSPVLARVDSPRPILEVSSTVSTPSPTPVPKVDRTVAAPANSFKESYDTEVYYIESHLRNKRFNLALRNAESLKTGIPAGDSNADTYSQKLNGLIKQSQEGSAQYLSALLQEAQQLFEKGDIANLNVVLSPNRIEGLLPDQLAQAQAKRQEYTQLSQAKAQELEEKRRAELERLRADFSKSLPSTVPAIEGRLIFGSTGVAEKSQITVGQESLATPAGKVAYLDGTRKVNFEATNSDYGMLGASTLVIQYSAAEPVDLVVKANAQQFGWLGGTVNLQPGELKTVSVPINRSLYGKGGTEGRSIKKFELDVKNPKPGTLTVLQVSVK